MLRIDQLRLLPGEDPSVLARRAARVLQLPEKDILSLRLVRRSIDAREGVCFICSVLVQVKNEEKVLRRCRSHQVSRAEKLHYAPPAAVEAPAVPPVVVGAGPAGLFAALLLAEAGAKPILLERGQPVERRQQDVERFWRTGVLDTASNVQFGEGGAGAFSDGKLNTGTKDPRHRYILHRLVEFGAPEEILYDAKPHVGTDKLHLVLVNLRRRLLSCGADLRFGHRLADLALTDGRLAAVTVEGPEGTYRLPCEKLLLAPGHSARDTFEMLLRRHVPMEPKAFAVGVRIEHRQKDMDAAQYKEYAGHPALPASSYKLACHLPSGRGVFSFCVCPGGQVVAAASEEKRVVTNGMSEFARDGENINGGLLVSVTPADFGGEGPLAGVEFQRRLESAAYLAGGGGYAAPAQRVGDFLRGVPSTGPGRVRPSYLPHVTWTDLNACLPDFVTESLRQALPLLEAKLPGFAAEDAILTAVESRSSSPVRILRGDAGESPLPGLYPCGEGAGYAGGILSAAADGMRQAEAILQSCR
ncbi:MAG: NAD(P)/FAD-dependent oxidoreductase [Oscillospiraceae bacterium]